MKTIITLAAAFLFISALFFVFENVARAEEFAPYRIWLWNEEVEVVAVDAAYCDSGVAPLCITQYINYGNTVWGFAKHFRSPNERTVDAKNRIVAIERNRAQFENVSPRLKKISNEPGHWIFPGQKIVIPAVSLVAKQAVEAAAKKAAAQARGADIYHKFVTGVLVAALIAAFVALICAVIGVWHRENKFSAPRTPEERETMINDPNWGKENKSKDPDKKIGPSDWHNFDPKILLIGFSFFALATNAYAGEITDLNDLENPLLIALIILITVRYLPLLLNLFLNFLSAKLDVLEKESIQRIPKNPPRSVCPSVNSPKAKVIKLFRDGH